MYNKRACHLLKLSMAIDLPDSLRPPASPETMTAAVSKTPPGSWSPGYGAIVPLGTSFEGAWRHKGGSGYAGERSSVVPPGLNPGSLAGTCSGWADGSADEAGHTLARTNTRIRHTSHTNTGSG